MAIIVALHEASEALRSQPGLGSEPPPARAGGMSVDTFSPRGPVTWNFNPPCSTAVAGGFFERALSGCSAKIVRSLSSASRTGVLVISFSSFRACCLQADAWRLSSRPCTPRRSHHALAPARRTVASFYQPIGAQEKRRRQREPERTRGAEIDHERICGWLARREERLALLPSRCGRRRSAPPAPVHGGAPSAVPEPDPRTRSKRIVLQGEVANPAAPPGGCYFHPRCPYAIEMCRTQTPAWQEITPAHFVGCHRAHELQLAGVE